MSVVLGNIDCDRRLLVPTLLRLTSFFLLLLMIRAEDS